MSLQAYLGNLFHNGQFLLRYLRRLYFKDIVLEVPKLDPVVRGVGTSVEKSPLGVTSVKDAIQYHARRVLIDNVLQRVTHPLNADLRKRASRRLFHGDSAPFFSLVGVSLASGGGLLTKDDESEGICREVREAVSKLQWNLAKGEVEDGQFSELNESTSLKDLEFGEPIATGCNAAVYTARLKKSESKDYPLAVKMMFNYDIESNSSAIIRAMYRETVPSRSYFFHPDIVDLIDSPLDWRKALPPHRNIIEMYCAFADRIPELPDCRSLYPDALPSRINSDGYGRNMSLFLVMKRYHYSLKEYIRDKKPSQRVSILVLTQLLEAVAHMNLHGIAHRDLKSDNILVDLSEGENFPTVVVTDFGCCLCDKQNGLFVPYRSSEIDKGGNQALMAPEIAGAKWGPFSTLNYTKSDLWAVGTIAYELFGMENPFYDKSKRLKSISYRESDLPALPDSVPFIIRSLVSNILSRSAQKRMTCDQAATVAQLYLWAPSSWLKSDGAVPNRNKIMQWLLCLTTKVLCEGRFSASFNPISEESLKMKLRRSLPEYELIASFLRRVRLQMVRRSLTWVHDLYL
ncbi:UNVERIFIED_CONTAM: hypothetical protein PYX00_004451 [Menopon gallinae]|uniref:non-specific serine/threonine protein kinase n=1 Tax=Menopon gallinae TaxID=328185 RepID=A0AAW2I4I3_9NEOP